MLLFTYNKYIYNVKERISPEAKLLVENIGVEPMTYCVQGSRSSQLS
jgi:hypothetical protein